MWNSYRILGETGKILWHLCYLQPWNTLPKYIDWLRPNLIQHAVFDLVIFSSSKVMPTLWHMKGKNFKTFLLGNWQSVFCIKILPSIRALICYINRNQKKICILSAMEKDPKVISCSEQHIVHVTTWQLRHTLIC